MGMMDHARRLRYVWSWRFTYWWLDTRGGEYAHWALLCVSVFVVVVQLVKMFVQAALPQPPDEPVKSIYWWVVQLVVAIIAAVVSYATRPKTEPPKPQSGDAPTVEDGLAVKHHFGECWIGDEFQLAWKMMGTRPIKTKGGKK